MEATYAAIWAGLVVVPVNTRLAAQEVCQILKDCDARALAFDRTHEDTARSVARDLGLARTIGLDHAEASLHWTDLLRMDRLTPCNAGSRDVLGLYYTGGTTGLPKGVALSHASFELTAMDQAHALECTGDSVYLHAAPYFHLADCSVGNSITYVQGTHVFSDDTSSRGILAAVRDLGVNFLNIVPTMYQDLIQVAAGDPVLARIENARLRRGTDFAGLAETGADRLSKRTAQAMLWPDRDWRSLHHPPGRGPCGGQRQAENGRAGRRSAPMCASLPKPATMPPGEAPGKSLLPATGS